jgi:valyl-tRNA synthetase
MPFVTEELWQHLKQRLSSDWQATESIMVAAYPEAEDGAIDPQAERVMEAVIEIIRSIRDVHAHYKEERAIFATRLIRSIPPVEAIIYADELLAAIASYAQTIQKLARAKRVTFLDRRQKSAVCKNAVVLVLKESEVIIPMESMIDLEAERKRIQGEVEQSQAEVSRLEGRLKDRAFLTKAPTAVIDKERQKLYALTDKLGRLKQQLTRFQA